MSSEPLIVNQTGQSVGLAPVGVNAAIQDQKMENLIKRILTVMAVIIALSLVLMAFGFACSMGVHGLPKIPSWIGSTSLGVGATLFIFSLGSIIALKILDKQRLEQKQKYTDELQKKTAELQEKTAELQEKTAELYSMTGLYNVYLKKLISAKKTIEDLSNALEMEYRKHPMSSQIQRFNFSFSNVSELHQQLSIMIKKYSEKPKDFNSQEQKELDMDSFMYQQCALFLSENPTENFDEAYQVASWARTILRGQTTPMSSFAMSQEEIMAFQIFRAAKKEIDTHSGASLDITLERFTQYLVNNEKISDWQDLVEEKNASLGNSTSSSSSS